MKLLLSGGGNEAISMKLIALNNNVGESDILIEKKSKNTIENFIFSK